LHMVKEPQAPCGMVVWLVATHIMAQIVVV